MAAGALSAERCKNGHLRTPANTGTDSQGYRRCKACRREREAEARRRQAPSPDRRFAAYLANPWAGREACPSCGSSDWTMPYHPETPWWVCVRGCHGGCGITFVPQPRQLVLAL